MNITKVVNFVKLGYKIFEQWCIIEKKNNFHKMYILTVLLHKKWDGHKLQTDEMSRHHRYRSELSFRRKKDLRCTAHTTISLSSQVMSMFKKKKKKNWRGRGKVTIYNRGETNKLERLQKVTWWLLPYSHTHLDGWKTRLNWPWFHKHILFFHRFKLYKEFLRNPIL